MVAATFAGCQREPAPKYSAAAGPSLVPAPVESACTQALLDRVSPWTGSVVERQSVEHEDDFARAVRTDWVLCGGIDERLCAEWAQEMGARRAKDQDLTVEVLAGRSDRGKLWVLRVDDVEEAHLFETNRELVTFFRSLDRDGKRAVVLSSDRVIEARSGRVEITYWESKGMRPRPTTRWVYEIANETQALVEATLAFEDLERQGIQLDYESWSELHRVTRNAAGVQPGYYPQLETIKAKPSTREPLRLTLEVSCSDG